MSFLAFLPFFETSFSSLQNLSHDTSTIKKRCLCSEI